MNQTEYGFIAISRSAIIGFSISNPTYKKWFKTGYTIFDEPTLYLMNGRYTLADKSM